MFESYLDVISLSLNVEDVLERLITGLLCGILIALFYRRSFRSTYVPAFVASLILLTLTTSCVIMVIGDSLARAFGLAGAMSIIRFRAALKDTHDIMFVFFALTIGLAVGVGLNLIALTGTLFIGTVAWILKVVSGKDALLTDILNGAKNEAREDDAELSFEHRPDPEATVPAYQAVLDRYCKSAQLLRVKSAGKEGKREILRFGIELKDQRESNQLIRHLAQLPSVTDIRMVFNEDDDD